MADEHAQAQDHAWAAVDAAPDSPLPAPSFDEPLAWPETDMFVPEDVRPVLPSDVWPEEATAPATPDGFPIPGGNDHQQWLDGLDLGALDHNFAGRNGTELDAERDLRLDPLPDSLWADDPVAEPLNQPDPPVATSDQPPPTVYAEPSHRPGRGKRWLEVRHGNAAVVALISFVSLVLVGMFLSVRARNELPTDTSQSRTPTGEIAAQGPLNTIPTPTTATTSTAPPSVSIADLIPGADAGAGAGTDAASVGTGSGGGGAAGRGSGTTAAPSRLSGPSGSSGGGGSGSGSGGGGSGAPAQPTDTTPPASEQPAPTSPPATDPPVQDTTPRTPRTTSPPRTVPEISVPTITVPPEPTPTTSVSWPSFPDIPDID